MADSESLPWERTFVENMIRARKAQNMSQTELAKRAAERGLSFHQQTVQRIEQGARPVRLNEAMVLADVLLMDSLEEAITPHSAETARSALDATVRDSWVRLTELARDIWRLYEQATHHSQELFTERSFFVRTATSLGEDIDSARSAASEAERLLLQWQAVRSMLEVAFGRAADEEFGDEKAEGWTMAPRNPYGGVEAALGAYRQREREEAREARLRGESQETP